MRLPGAMGNTIGIVGGLIIGQAAVDANIVSPMVVIVVAFTALCSFAIPNEDFATAFRLLKFVFIGSIGSTWFLRISARAAHSADSSGTAGKFWHAVSDAVCGG